MTSRLTESVDRLITAMDALAALDPDGTSSRPLPGASEEQITNAQRVRGTRFPAGYVEFLSHYDGWPDFPFGMRLFGVEELAGPAYDDADETRGYSLEAGHDLPDELVAATIIGKSDNNAGMVLLLASGAVVEFFYQEEDRHADIAAYLDDRRASVLRFVAEAEGLQAAAVRDWGPDHRAAKEAALLADLRVRPPQTVVTGTSAPVPLEPYPDAVAATDLVVRAGTGDGPKVRAAVMLNLQLYLGSYPSAAEVRGCFRAFRRHFPVPGTMSWAAPHRFFLIMTPAPDPDDESWAQRLHVDPDGMFGLRLMVKPPGADHDREYLLNVCGLPPDADGRPRASFCEVVVPADEDPARLAALARELSDLLPVRSGHGGYAAYEYGQEPRHHDVFAWCRRFVGLDVGYVDAWLDGVTTGLVGASWLTVLGPAFTAALSDHPVPAGVTADGIRGGGLLLRAGDAPTLGDVARGEFPATVAAVERWLRPYKLTGSHRVSLLFLSGEPFTVTERELPGGFEAHRMTAAWLDRLTDPGRWLGGSPREHAEALLTSLVEEYGGDGVDRWRRECERNGGYFPVLLDLLQRACPPGRYPPLVIEALELMTSFGDVGPDVAYPNLIHAYLIRGELDKGVAFLPRALERAPDIPTVYHNAACLAVRLGDHDQALSHVESAKAHGYEGLASLRADDDLRPLWTDPRFIALIDA